MGCERMVKIENEYRLCECGCGTEILKYDNYGRLRHFVNGHQNIGRVWTQEHKDKISRTEKLTGGRKHTYETRLKISKSMKRYWRKKRTTQNLKPTEMV